MLFEHHPHPHIAARKEAGPTKSTDVIAKPDGKLGFNARFAMKITGGVGTMQCAYIFTAIALVSLPAAILSGSVIVIVSWAAQTFLQLVLLSVIIVGQNIQAATSDQRGDDTYKDAEAVLHECLELQRHLQTQDVILEGLHLDAIGASRAGIAQGTEQPPSKR